MYYIQLRLETYLDMFLLSAIRVNGQRHTSTNAHTHANNATTKRGKTRTQANAAEARADTTHTASVKDDAKHQATQGETVCTKARLYKCVNTYATLRGCLEFWMMGALISEDYKHTCFL